MSERAESGMPWWFYALFIGAGVVFIAVGAWATGSSRRFLATAVEAEGRIVDYTAHRDIDDDRMMYSAVVEFTAADGRARRFTSNVNSSRLPDVGRQVTVLYDPGNPDNARLESWSALWMLPTIFLGMGALFFALGLVLWIILRRKPGKWVEADIDME